MEEWKGAGRKGEKARRRQKQNTKFTTTTPYANYCHSGLFSVPPVLAEELGLPCSIRPEGTHVQKHPKRAESRKLELADFTYVYEKVT